MPNERTPLKLAEEIMADIQEPFDQSKGNVRRVAAALIEQSTPVVAHFDCVGTCSGCRELLSGYARDYRNLKRPNYCPSCGKGITWK